MSHQSKGPASSFPEPDNGKEGHMPVPGGVLHYRVAGPESAKDVVVFENGWTASFPTAAWLEQALAAAQVRVICYDRAGIGQSRSTEPQTTARLTEQLLALLAGLGIAQPVVVVGHSYGGLIAALHAAQTPERVRALVQVDPTPEFEHADIDKKLTGTLETVGATKLAIRLGLGGLIYSVYKELPPEAYQRVTQSRSWLVSTLEGSVPELRLFPEIRRVISASEAARQCPRLVISGAEPPKERGALMKLLISDAALAKMMAAVQSLHQRQARLNSASRWMSLPYSHVGLIINRRSANAIAERVLEFIR
jgi:pimeloyl-ACP methyl ester carboxylesterase